MGRARLFGHLRVELLPARRHDATIMEYDDIQRNRHDCQRHGGMCVQSHRRLGPGLLESIYQRCLAHELRKAGIRHRCEVPLPIVYDEEDLGPAYKMDMVIESAVIVENKAVLQLLPIHQAQLLTYLKLTDFRLGLLINWNVVLLKDGLKRIVNKF